MHTLNRKELKTRLRWSDGGNSRAAAGAEKHFVFPAASTAGGLSHQRPPPHPPPLPSYNYWMRSPVITFNFQLVNGCRNWPGLSERQE